MNSDKIKQKFKVFFSKKIVRFFYSKTFIIHFSIMAVVFALLSFAMIQYLNSYTNHDQKITVPNLSKKSIAQAKVELEKLKLRYKVVDSSVYKPSYPKKSVIAQNPAPGSFVKQDRMIYLNINAWGYRNIAVPNFYGKTRRRAVSDLENSGFIISPTEEFVSDVAINIVRGIKYKGNKINAGDKLPKTSELTLVLGDGKGTSRYVENSEEVDE